METGAMLPDLIGEQCRILYLSDKDNQVVLGVAGSGKSVEAIYRAFWLSLAHPDEKILILTYNNQINKDLTARLDVVKRRFNNLAQPTNIEIQTIYTYFNKLINRYRKPADPYFQNSPEKLTAMVPKEEKELLDLAIESAQDKLPHNPLWNRKNLKEFVRDEFKWMQNMKLSEDNKDKYLTMNRIGRGSSRILSNQRPAMLEIFNQFYKKRKAYFSNKNKEKYFTFEDIYLLVKEHCDIPEEEKPKYIIIDEVQDITPSMFEGLNSVIQKNGVWNVFGDLSQNIFGGRISWKSIGIDKVKKIYRLHHNYRNTKEIGQLGKSILDNLLTKTDNISDTNSEYFIEPELSAFSGAKPILCQKDDIKLLEKLHEYVNNGTTAVLTIGNTSEAKEKLEAACFNIINSIEEVKPGVIYLTTAGRSKGLEFDNVVVYGIDSPERDISFDNLDENGYLSDDLDEETQIEVARNIYVALTRARKNLILTYHTNSLPFLFTDSDLIEEVQG